MRIEQGFGVRLWCGVLVAAFACPMFGCSSNTRRGFPSREAMRKMMERARRNDKAPKLGATAPDFTLKTLDAKREVKLAAFRGAKPVVLVFGSYT